MVKKHLLPPFPVTSSQCLKLAVHSWLICVEYFIFDFFFCSGNDFQRDDGSLLEFLGPAMYEPLAVWFLAWGRGRSLLSSFQPLKIPIAGQFS